MPRQAGIIDGVAIGSTEEFETRNPSDLDEVVGRYSHASEDQIDEAVASAVRSQRSWRDTGPLERSERLSAVADRLEESTGSMSSLIAREEGKILAEARSEVARAAKVFRFYAQEALRLAGERLPSLAGDSEISIHRDPVGIVAAITPWNYPLSIAAWKIAPALAFGNAVVLKPSEIAPGAALQLAILIEAAGIPAGLVNVVLGDGRAGQRLTSHRKVDAISFTGSSATGSLVVQAAAARLAKVQLELGGKSALIVLDDADLDRAVEATLRGAFFGTGQNCTASSRLVVARRIGSEFVDKLIERASALRVGGAMDENVDLGPVASAPQLAKNLAHVASGIAEGATLAFGGTVVEARRPGNYFAPGLFIGTHNQMRINQEEMFGPVPAVIEVEGYDEALEVANDTPYGLSASIFTNRLSVAQDFVRRSRSGIVRVNLPTNGLDFHVPMSGRGASGYGAPEQGRQAAEFFTALKTSYVAG